MNPAPRVTVIMRTKNAAWVVHQALAGLAAQTYRDYELLVIDSGSTDRTLDIVQQYPCRLLTIAAEDYVPGVVLNLAGREARGELLVFQNSDVVPLVPDALGALVQAFADPQVTAAFGRQLPRPEAEPWVRRDYAMAFPPVGPAPPWLALSLCFAAMRRSAWQRRPFYTDAWASEDTEWGERARRAGEVVAYVPQALVMHSHNYTLRQIYGRRFVEGEADAFIYRRNASAWRLVRRYLGSLAADIRHDLPERAFRDLVTAPARRAVYHWAHFQGMRLGLRRIATGDTDISKGQQTVLSRYE